MDYNRALNAALIGWAITLLAILLNVLTWLDGLGGYRGIEVLGIMFGVLTLVCGYFGESFAAMSSDGGSKMHAMLFRARVLSLASIALCVLSYLMWLYAILTY